MLVVRIELHSARTGKVTTLGTAIIANVGGTAERGDYDVKVARKGTTDLRAIWSKPLRTARIENYPRLSYTVWELVRRALNAVYGKRRDAFEDGEEIERRPSPEAVLEGTR